LEQTGYGRGAIDIPTLASIDLLEQPQVQDVGKEVTIEPAAGADVAPETNSRPKTLEELQAEIVVSHTQPSATAGSTGPRPTSSSFESARDGSLTIVVRKAALARAQQHALQDTSNEAGGVLLGQLVPIGPERVAVVITGIVRALLAVGRPTSVNFPSAAWSAVWRAIDSDPHYADDSKWSMVGWYHTHPGFGIFLSSLDLSIHKEHFRLPGHVALVIDPKGRDTWGFFCWDRKRNDIIRCPPDQVKSLDDAELLAWLRDQAKTSLEALPAPEVDTRHALQAREELAHSKAPEGVRPAPGRGISLEGKWKPATEEAPEQAPRPEEASRRGADPVPAKADMEAATPGTERRQSTTDEGAPPSTQDAPRKDPESSRAGPGGDTTSDPRTRNPFSTRSVT